jgi:hypothetical protein
VNQANFKLLAQYVLTIEKELAAGNATEHTHRPALKTLIEGLAEGTTATNEPTHIECGAPDFVITRGVTTIGYIEAKDVGKSLDEAEKSEQLKRYRDSLTNLILTDYLEFRWYVDGERRLSASLGAATEDGKVKRDKAGTQAVSELLSGFLSHEAEAVGTPKELALRMARLAHLIRNLIINTFTLEAEKGSLHIQLAAFRENLIPDLSNEQFADMYAQTIAYGLFAARCTAPEIKPFTRQSAAYLLPKTNPFLRKLFNHIAGPELDERIAWCVDDLAQVLDQADMAEVIKDFGKHLATEDPVVHFYETFLKAYDPAVREMRGVYYTPEPVVSYIVRSIDYLLRKHFDTPQGLVDPSVLILDPAVGTATFLYKTINEIHANLTKQGQQGLWNDYVAQKLLPRLFGFELLMAPYAIAHLKLGLLLQETGYQFQSDQRLGIYLTNTLEEGFKKAEQLAGFNEYIVDEANAAAEVKKEKPIMVVLGNPPYSVTSANTGKWITELIDGVFDKDGHETVNGYKTVNGQPLGEKNPKMLHDDYVKFIRFGQWRIDRTGKGILGFISNHGYLDNLTFRGMRQKLMDTFTDIYVINLHGNAKKKEIAPDGSKDENVFDIQQGVCIGIFVKTPDKAGRAKVRHADLWGLRQEKYKTLIDADVSSTLWKELNPKPPFYFFVPQDTSLSQELESAWSITDIFLVGSGAMNTARDHFVIDSDRRELCNRISELRASNLSLNDLADIFKLRQTEWWSLDKAVSALKSNSEWEGSITRVLYRPFDFRWLFFDANFIDRPRLEVNRHILKPNISLVATRQTKEPFAVLCTNKVCGQHKIVAVYDRSFIFPLYVYSSEHELQIETERRPNLQPNFVKALSEKLSLKFIQDGKGDLEESFGPEDIFNYAYAVFHSPTYRSRYGEFLKIDFPRLPLTSDRELFKALADKGAELVALHLMESPALDNLITKYPVTGSNVVEKVGYDETTKRVYINKEQYFEGVPPEVWNFHIGGYQVCEKWLKDRKVRKLTIDEAQHYQRIVVALKETIRLMAKIDALIPGWPIA